MAGVQGVASDAARSAGPAVAGVAKRRGKTQAPMTETTVTLKRSSLMTTSMSHGGLTGGTLTAKAWIVTRHRSATSFL
jgi:hypothetical protein